MASRYGPAPMTDEAFLAYCEEHEGLSVETSAEGRLILMPPAGTATGYQNSDLNYQVSHWARRSKTGRAFDSSTLFALPQWRSPVTRLRLRAA